MNICLYGASSPALDRAYFDAAEEFGRLLAQHGHTLVYGGGAQGVMGEAKRQAENQAAAFETDLNSKTAAQCRALEQAAASRSGAAAAMIVERIWDSEWQS